MNRRGVSRVWWGSVSHQWATVSYTHLDVYKRQGLARAIAMKPHYVLYDEPTTGLDPVTADAINVLIRGLQQQLGITSIVVTHDMKSAEKRINALSTFSYLFLPLCALCVLRVLCVTPPRMLRNPVSYTHLYCSGWCSV